MKSIKIINRSNNPLPRYESEGAAGMDIRADLFIPMAIKPRETAMIPTGLYMEIPAGYECQIRSRSGLALAHGIIVLNAPATIDSDYRGQVGVILHNVSDEEYVVHHGERIAQLVFAKVEQAKFTIVEELSTTERGAGGFGHSGVK